MLPDDADRLYACEDCHIIRRVGDLTAGCPRCGETMVPYEGEAVMGLLRSVNEMLAVVRQNPDNSRVTWRFNQGEWKTSMGREFLELWEHPAAGTIYVDRVISPLND